MTATLTLKAGRRSVDITRPEKQLFPGGITKEDVARYYAEVAAVMLPHVRDRAISMERYPDGIEGEKIFQKNASKYFPSWIAIAEMPKKGGVVRHVLANDAATLVYLANQAAIAQHIGLARVDKPMHPDLLVFDRDPSGPDFGLVRRTALEIRDTLDAAGLVPYVKTSGSKGLHVVAPLRRTSTFDATYAFAHALVERLIERHPRELTLEFHKSERGTRIYMDVGRNGYGATYVAPYSLRAKPDAPVSAPVTWEEIESAALTPTSFTLATMRARLDDVGDLWSDMRANARPLPRRQP